MKQYYIVKKLLFTFQILESKSRRILLSEIAMEWENFEPKVQRVMQWMKREVWLIVCMLFLAFLIWMVCIVEWEASQPFFWSPTALFEITFLSTLPMETHAIMNHNDEQAVKATSVVGREAVERFRAHLDCFSESGKWVYDPTPRHIPWSYVGDPYANVCEYRHMSADSHHVANEMAEDIAMRGQPGNWTVREELKWVWQTNGSCPWRPINRDDFCRKIGAKRNIMFVGDSINHEIQWALMNALITNGSGYERLDGSSRTNIAPYEMCSDIFGKGEGFTVSFIVNVHLTTNLVAETEDSILYPWIDLLNEYETKILLLNRGAHYQDDEAYTSRLREVFTILTEKYPHIYVIYRNTEPGHADCMNFTQPLSEAQTGLPVEYHWDDFKRQNGLAKQIVEEFKYTYMDVFAMLYLRPEAHISPGDCLHYCLPGPLDIAVEYLYNILLLI